MLAGFNATPLPAAIDANHTGPNLKPRGPFSRTAPALRTRRVAPEAFFVVFDNAAIAASAFALLSKPLRVATPAAVANSLYFAINWVKVKFIFNLLCNGLINFPNLFYHVIYQK